MKTKHLLLYITAALTIVLYASCQSKSKAQDKATKPNILFILADDWSYPYAGFYGDKSVRTPNLDQLAKEGVVFNNAFCAAPTCSPSRSAILTGKYPHRLGEAVNLVGKFDTAETTYHEVLQQNGYAVAFERKGWGPGQFEKMGFKENPCGKQQDFYRFVDSIPTNQSFCFWFGTNDPHRGFEVGSGTRQGIDSSKIDLPKFLPDNPIVRGDVGDYLAEIERIDREVGQMIAKLKEKGLYENTIIVVTGDNGMPFPHAKANLYDYGTRVPLLIFYPKQFPKSQPETMVNLIDIAPTFLDMAGLKMPKAIDGKSLVPILRGSSQTHRDLVFLERERHCLCRKEGNDLPGYPMRAVRDKQFLYIQNLRPNRTPAGDATIQGTPSEYGDVDGGPTKAYLIDNATKPELRQYLKYAFDKRPFEELYDVSKDPYNLVNIAEQPTYSPIKKAMQKKLEDWMVETNDPRQKGGGDVIDTYPPYSKAWITKWSIVFFE
jgi:N-sulfoglucosamine sulfohydrolase